MRSTSNLPRRVGRRLRTMAQQRALTRSRSGPADEDLAPTAVSPTASRLSGRTGPTGLLVPDPVFVFSSVRSGSTLLRMVLDSHSQIYAPHEMHLASLKVEPTKANAAKALRTMGLDNRLLENLLWDRVLQLRLAESGKRIIVDKTPNTTFQWDRVAAFWPGARPLFLLRHPLRVAESLIHSRPDIDTEAHYARVSRYAEAISAAQNGFEGGLTVRYEALTAEPERVTRDICTWLEVPWEPTMLEYGRQQHDGKFKRGLGDWSDNIRSGVIQPAADDPTVDEIPRGLLRACRLLGYLPE